MTGPHRLAPWRRAFQWTTGLALLLIPFGRWGGESLLRVDLPNRTLLAFGRVLRLDELYLVLLLALAVILVLLLLTLVLGRVWCGWACPQTALCDFTDGLARTFGVPVRAGRHSPRPWQVPLLHGLYAALGLLVGANLVWYFISPYAFFPLLLKGALPGPAVGTLAVVGGAVYLDLAFVRRDVCRSVCPYGRIQTALVDAGTLTLGVLPGAADRCIQCRACVRACPTGIDIREGYQVGCINCGRCRDACREAMGRRREAGVIGYTFGTEGRGPRSLLTPRTAAVALAAAAALTGLVVTAATLNPLTLSVRRSAAPIRALPEGGTAVFFTGYASNRSRGNLLLSLTARGPGGGALEVRGPVRSIPVGAGDRRQLDFVLVVPKPASPYPVVFRLAAPGGTPAAEARAELRLAPGGGTGG